MRLDRDDFRVLPTPGGRTCLHPGDRKLAWVGLASLAAILISTLSRADEVDDILAKRAHHRDHLQKLSGEYFVDTDQPSNLKNPKTTHLHYRMTMQRMPKEKVKNPNNPWAMDVEVIEPHAMKLRTEGETAYFLDHKGQWVELTMLPWVAEQFSQMGERFVGADPSEYRKHFSVKVLRHNNPIFGPKTSTIEIVPKGRAKLFERLEEDVDADGLAISSRIYDKAGKQTVRTKVTRHHVVNGFPVVDRMESESESVIGSVTTVTACVGAQVDTLDK